MSQETVKKKVVRYLWLKPNNVPTRMLYTEEEAKLKPAYKLWRKLEWSETAEEK